MKNSILNRENSAVASAIITKVGMVSTIRKELTDNGWAKFDKFIITLEDNAEVGTIRINGEVGNFFAVNKSKGSRRNWAYIFEQIKRYMCFAYGIADITKFDSFHEWATEVENNAAEKDIKNYIDNDLADDLYINTHLNIMREEQGEDFDFEYEVGNYVNTLFDCEYEKAVHAVVSGYDWKISEDGCLEWELNDGIWVRASVECRKVKMIG